MSDEFDYQNGQSASEARADHTENGGSSVEYGPRFFGVDGDRQGTKKNGRVGVIALLVAVAVLLLALVAVGGILIMRGIGSGAGSGAQGGTGSGGGSGAANSGSLGAFGDTVVMHQTNNKATIEDGSVAAVAAKSADFVVEILTESVGTRYPNKTVSGAGSGVIISESKTQDYTYIVTNNHVVEGFETIIVRTTSGVEYTATVIGTDWLSDIAVLRIGAKGLPIATYVSADEPLVLGQEVVAIGNPLGSLGGSVSRGIISGLSRTITIEGIPMTLLQTDAAINPGNSGGGLFDMNGNLVGIVNAKSIAENVDNIGFAIPIATAIDAVSEIIEKGYVSGRADLGFTFTSSATTSGLTVYSYAYNNEISTPIESGYVLYSVMVNGKELVVSSADSYRSVLAHLTIGETAQAKIYKPVRQGISITYSPFTVTLTVHEYTAS